MELNAACDGLILGNKHFLYIHIPYICIKTLESGSNLFWSCTTDSIWCSVRLQMLSISSLSDENTIFNISIQYSIFQYFAFALDTQTTTNKNGAFQVTDRTHIFEQNLKFLCHYGMILAKIFIITSKVLLLLRWMRLTVPIDWTCIP